MSSSVDFLAVCLVRYDASSDADADASSDADANANAGANVHADVDGTVEWGRSLGQLDVLGLEARISLPPQLIASAFRRCKIYIPSCMTAPVYFICEQVCKGQCGRLYLSNLAFELLHWKC